jgi:hypothetical protein
VRLDRGRIACESFDVDDVAGAVPS